MTLEQVKMACCQSCAPCSGLSRGKGTTLTGSGVSGQLWQFLRGVTRAIGFVLQPIAGGNHVVYILCSQRLTVANDNKERGVTGHAILFAKFRLLIHVNVDDFHAMFCQPREGWLCPLAGTAPCRTEGENLGRCAAFLTRGRLRCRGTRLAAHQHRQSHGQPEEAAKQDETSDRTHDKSPIVRQRARVVGGSTQRNRPSQDLLRGAIAKDS